MKVSGATMRSVTWSMVAMVAVGALLIVAWHIWVVPIGHPVYGLFNMNIDTRVYRGGALAVWNDRPLYDLPVYKVWQFTYPPFAALLMLPLAPLPEHTAQFLWNAGNVVCLLALVGVSLRALRFRIDGRFVAFTVLFAVSVIGLEPVHTTFWNGQINLVLALLVIADQVRRSDRLRGVGIGLASGVKLTPIFFTAYLVLTKQWRAAITAVVTFAATVALGIAVLGDEGWHFWTVTLEQTGRIGPLYNAANQSLNGFFARLPALGLGTAPDWLWIPAGVVVGLLGLWAALAAHRAGQELLALSITGMTSCAVSPFSWGHHWVWVVPLLLVAVTHCVDVADRRRPITWLCWLAPATVVALTFTWWHRSFVVGPDGQERLKLTFGVFRIFRGPVTGDWELPFRLAGSGAYVLLLLLTIVVTLCLCDGRRAIRFKPSDPADPKPVQSETRS
ncbi:glycosyltransferase 87 family protein [Gordonia sp. (in: high G+C Gram-positive bacteria)]|uniref:glycosyltransferase 87 family protein n=1 Tax=Gordonia sp. (in: high G+C Gram-positive bacteria) TaxID=84139 RepID=UPI0025BBD71E|nr:glycosyltransferase 87 family protein [Gordonia sp. (in: high G+C Gram-positive bacteria)]